MTLMLVMLTAMTAWADGFSFTHDTDFGALDQSVNRGYSIQPILFHYEGITNWSVTGLPTGLVSVNESKDQQIWRFFCNLVEKNDSLSAISIAIYSI
jgi:hypothetical protein